MTLTRKEIEADRLAREASSVLARRVRRVLVHLALLGGQVVGDTVRLPTRAGPLRIAVSLNRQDCLQVDLDCRFESPTLAHVVLGLDQLPSGCWAHTVDTGRAATVEKQLEEFLGWTLPDGGYPLPYALDWKGSGLYKPGRGEAGWTVARFRTREERKAFMQRHSESRMPCWGRIERKDEEASRTAMTLSAAEAADLPVGTLIRSNEHGYLTVVSGRKLVQIVRLPWRTGDTEPDGDPVPGGDRFEVIELGMGRLMPRDVAVRVVGRWLARGRSA